MAVVVSEARLRGLGGFYVRYVAANCVSGLYF